MWRILVVDDNFANRMLLTEILREAAVCDVAANGREAIEAYNLSIDGKRPYDLVLLDVAMPEIDGLQFLTMVRDAEKAAGVMLGEGLPIIMVTAHEKPFMKAFISGCDDYVIKPVNGAELLGKIKEKLGKRGKA
jgi:two-component system chemotaxis response regulator CheY